MDLRQELHKKIEKIEAVFNIAEVLSLKIDDNYIKRYYRINKIPYSIFHSRKDLIYMGISRDGKFKEDDLLEAARTVEQYIRSLGGRKVLELATGRGANSFYLAKRHPNIQFWGIDISPSQLGRALRKAKLAQNYHPELGDYHILDKFEDNEFDIVFVVEALCYSGRKDRVLSEIYRILKPGGVFIIFDGYRKQAETSWTKEQQLAETLIERGMALNKFESYESFRKKTAESKLTIESEEDVSSYVIPTMEKFERLANRLFNSPLLAKIIVKILPKEFTYNAISGYLMPTLIKMGVAAYIITILKKPKE